MALTTLFGIDDYLMVEYLNYCVSRIIEPIDILNLPYDVWDVVVSLSANYKISRQPGFKGVFESVSALEGYRTVLSTVSSLEKGRVGRLDRLEESGALRLIGEDICSLPGNIDYLVERYGEDVEAEAEFRIAYRSVSHLFMSSVVMETEIGALILRFNDGYSDLVKNYFQVNSDGTSPYLQVIRRLVSGITDPDSLLNTRFDVGPLRIPGCHKEGIAAMRSSIEQLGMYRDKLLAYKSLEKERCVRGAEIFSAYRVFHLRRLDRICLSAAEEILFKACGELLEKGVCDDSLDFNLAGMIAGIAKSKNPEYSGLIDLIGDEITYRLLFNSVEAGNTLDSLSVFERALYTFLRGYDDVAHSMGLA
ncbi:hypothetical protein HYU11_06230 [Candidatus Woesearchaeota archaeon]|nr:hypothetical protein [Candidatus Woesearchaeota archaeon]